MIYAAANIHGCYQLWNRLLKKINFKDTDSMFVLGDTIDIGDGGIELLEQLSYAQNIWPVAGRHEITARKYLSGFDSLLKSGAAPDPGFVEGIKQWLTDGGQPTFDAFRELDGESREGILEYLNDMPLYEEVRAGGVDYLLVNTGITGFDISKSLDDYTEDDLFGDSPVRKVPGYTVICGALQTTENFSRDGRIFRGDGFIDIDCGAARGGRLAAIRLDDGAEFYVE